jgi:outer membrane protein TolC
MKYRIQIIAFVFLMFSGVLKAQQIVPINKAKALSLISENNLALKISEEELNKAKADYRQTQAIYLPNITASYTGISTTNPLMAFGSKLNQGILTQNDFNPALLNNPDQTQNFSTKIEIQQPLVHLDGLFHRKAAKTKMEAISLHKARSAEYLSFEVEKAYMQLQLAYKGLAVLEKALLSAEEYKKLADNNFKKGYLQRADVLLVEVRLTEVKNQLQSAKSGLQNASDYLSFLMNEKGFILYKPTDSLVVNSFTTASESISENRADIKAMSLSTEAYTAINKADKMSFLPNLNAFGSYELNDNKLFQGNTGGYLVGVQLNWTLFEGSKRFGKTQHSKAAMEQSKYAYEQYVSKSNLEYSKAKRMLTDAENKLSLTKMALIQSEESLRIRTNRFKEGLEKTTDLLNAETQFAQKQLEYYQTIFEYNYAQSYLQFLTKE